MPYARIEFPLGQIIGREVREMGIGKKKRQKPEPIVTDPQGSYTGLPLEGSELPVQDVDDL